MRCLVTDRVVLLPLFRRCPVVVPSGIFPLPCGQRSFPYGPNIFFFFPDHDPFLTSPFSFCVVDVVFLSFLLHFSFFEAKWATPIRPRVLFVPNGFPIFYLADCFSPTQGGLYPDVSPASSPPFFFPGLVGSSLPFAGSDLLFYRQRVPRFFFAAPKIFPYQPAPFTFFSIKSAALFLDAEFHSSRGRSLPPFWLLVFL